MRDKAVHMNRASRAAAGRIGAYAGLLGAAHGVFEILQGNAVPTGYPVRKGNYVQVIGTNHPTLNEADGRVCAPPEGTRRNLPAFDLVKAAP